MRMLSHFLNVASCCPCRSGTCRGFASLKAAEMAPHWRQRLWQRARLLGKKRSLNRGSAVKMDMFHQE